MPRARSIAITDTVKRAKIRKTEMLAVYTFFPMQFKPFLSMHLTSPTAQRENWFSNNSQKWTSLIGYVRKCIEENVPTVLQPSVYTHWLSFENHAIPVASWHFNCNDRVHETSVSCVSTDFYVYKRGSRPCEKPVAIFKGTKSQATHSLQHFVF